MEGTAYLEDPRVPRPDGGIDTDEEMELKDYKKEKFELKFCTGQLPPQSSSKVLICGKSTP